MSEWRIKYQTEMTGEDINYTHTLSDGNEITRFSDHYVKWLESKLDAVRSALMTDERIFEAVEKIKNKYEILDITAFYNGVEEQRTRIEQVLDK